MAWCKISRAADILVIGSGGFASALLRGENAEEAVKYENVCGALATAKFGAQTSLPTFNETKDFIAGIEKIH